MATVRVLLADDNPLFCDALEAILTADDRIEVVGRAHDGVEAVERALDLRPDVVLMDISMPRLDGIAAAHVIRERVPGAEVLVVTGSRSREDVDRARRAGVYAYLTKDDIHERLVPTVLATRGR